MRVLVTGGSGFLGRFVMPLLVHRGHHVVALARSAGAAEQVERLGAKAIGGDLDQPELLDVAFVGAGADALVNLASLGFGHAPAIVAAAEDAGMARAVFVSTTAVMTTIDARSRSVRLSAEEFVRTSALSWTIVRPTMIYGAPGDRNLWRLLRLLRRSPIIPLPGGGRCLQQPVHVEDLATGIVAALETGTAIGRIYDLAGPEPLSFREVVEQAAAAVGRQPLLLPVPASPVARALRVAERMGIALPIKSEQIQRLLEDKAFDIADARRDLGYDPRPFAEGIAIEAELPGT